MTKISFGQLQYTSRAFNQDAQQAMRGDIIRALIELLTNADDAYTAKGGKIIISIEIDKNEKQRVAWELDRFLFLERQNKDKN